MRALVAVVRVTPDTVLSDIDRLVDLGGAAQALTPGCTTILKDNISWHFPFPAANTTPWQLEGTIQALSRRGYADQVCVQNKTVVTNAFKGEDLNHYVPIFRKYGVPVLYNFKDEDMKWVRYQPTTRMRVLDRIYPEGIRIPDFFFGKNIVHLPTTKCHIYTTTTGAMKNAFGGLLNTRRHYTHSWIHETLVDLLAIQKEIHSGLFAIMDGTTAGNGPGPRTMYPVVKNVMLASQDQVAIDAVAAKMMGFDPMSIPYIRLAHEQGLGIGDPRRIEIAGDVDAAHENWHFRVGKNLVRVAGGDLIWFGPLRRFQKLFFRTPLVNGFILASDVYHDFYRWPLVDRRRFERWCETTGWGQLFLRYARLGPQGEPFVARSQAAITVPTSTSVH
ncbi:MAG: iron-sulfur cluster-binding protein [Acidobacteria bacterium]|nr:MAG: iron-sulfur cluster-binding protein [Acidobacteriota bacterium]